MQNKDLKEVYDKMHSQGQSAWFSDGKEERELILKMGDPWSDKTVLEIGCGEGDLVKMTRDRGALTSGIDYSKIAIKKSREKYEFGFVEGDYHNVVERFNRIILQGVLEHLDNPFKELKWMMDNLLTKKGDVITSSPCFLNPRGIVWMTLDMLGAVMSKTDLHYLNPDQFNWWSHENGYKFDYYTCDFSWGWGTKMFEDLTERLPLALKDGKIKYRKTKLNKFLSWIEDSYLPHMDEESGFKPDKYTGATAVYKISK